MAELRGRVMACVKCANLAAARKNVVFGVGDIHSPLMFVGEAPGADEDEQGEPFVGKAGQLLTKIIETMGLSRGKVYIGNILKCRPDTPGQAFGNRKPTHGTRNANFVLHPVVLNWRKESSLRAKDQHVVIYPASQEIIFVECESTWAKDLLYVGDDRHGLT